MTCAIGEREGADLLLETAVKFSRAAGTPLRLVSLVALVPVFGTLRSDADAVRERALAHAYTTLETAKSALPEGFPVTSTIVDGPTVEEVERVGSFRDGLALVLGIALRPCSGALFVLVLTWQLGIALAGVAGAFVMGLGTALVTVAAALLAVWAREGALSGLGSGAVARAMPLVQLAVGAVIAVAAGGLLIASL